jgi:hypothetical protein
MSKRTYAYRLRQAYIFIYLFEINVYFNTTTNIRISMHFDEVKRLFLFLNVMLKIYIHIL